MVNLGQKWCKNLCLNGRICVNMAFIRKFKTGSGATGVQFCWKQGSEVVKTVHIGSANSDVALEKLLKKAQKMIDEGKRSLFDLNEFNREVGKKNGEK